MGLPWIQIVSKKGNRARRELKGVDEALILKDEQGFLTLWTDKRKRVIVHRTSIQYIRLNRDRSNAIVSNNQVFCIYCQKRYASPRNLRRHIEQFHPGTYAEANVNTNLKEQSS